MKFNQLSLSKELLKGIPFEELTEIQTKTIPLALKGRDILAQAKTGSGKTYSYLIPVLNKIFIPDNSPQTIILTPTRELAIQVSTEIEKLSSYIGKIKLVTCYGGQNIGKQVRLLNKGVHIIVGTPGRILDHIKRGTLDLLGVETVVVDEVDIMLSMGFNQYINEILSFIPYRKQTFLVSATISKDILEIAKSYQNNPIVIKSKKSTVSKINEYYLEVDYRDKINVLTYLIKNYGFKHILVFCNRKKLVTLVKRDLKNQGLNVECLHGDMNQVSRDKVLKMFRNGNVHILVASDVASRGLDIPIVEAVFNYDLPLNMDDYIHRMGRTARAGDKGYGFSFVEKDEFYILNEIRKISKISKMEI